MFFACLRQSARKGYTTETIKSRSFFEFWRLFFLLFKSYTNFINLKAGDDAEILFLILKISPKILRTHIKSIFVSYNSIMKKILVVEDEPEIRQLLASYLRNEGYAISEAEDGVSAIELFDKEKFDLIILDILIPKIDGYGVCEVVKSKSDVPVIFLSALGDERSMIRGYDSLADDYVTKPFSMPVFLRKVKAVLRRDLSSSKEDYEKICYKNIVMIPDLMKVIVDGIEVELTSKEFDLLLTLIKNPGRVYTREMLLEMLWDYNSLVDERIIDSHIKNLRHKLGEGVIETVRRRGYRVAKTYN